MLEVSGLNQSYGQSHTLWDVELAVPRGTCVSLIGRNGVGKTTLLGCLMGLVAVQSGAIRFDGRDLTRARPEERAPLGIGFVPQGRMIFPLLTVEENLRVGLPSAGRWAASAGAAKTARKNIPDLVFDLFPVLKSMLGRRGGDLSGGQQQQLAIGRALVLEPRMLILDEPTEGIQPSIVKEIGDVIERLRRDLGMTVLVVEQKLPFVRRFCDRFCVMDKGRIVATGAMAALTDDLVRAHLSV
ncbi:MAG TPA: urea ABC transporter ATP-binding subunit UrtE [Gammaproteobacteria bacterium]|nr:urea ABC transporter ATP-binding subunit UrtE [Gammaproteobacteria bacterium]